VNAGAPLDRSPSHYPSITEVNMPTITETLGQYFDGLLSDAEALMKILCALDATQDERYEAIDCIVLAMVEAESERV
jgi:hypothetical protein